MSSKDRAESADTVCHFNTCQGQRVKGFRLCQSCIDMSHKVGLKVWTYDESLNDTPDLGISIMNGRTSNE